MSGELSELPARVVMGKSGFAVGVLVAAFAVVHAGAALAQTPPGPEIIGEWSAVYDWESVLAPGPLDQEMGHAALLSTGLHAGKVLLFNLFPGDGTTRTWLLDPDSPAELIEINQQLSSNIFCGGKTFRPNGTLVVAGGFPPGGSGGAPTESYIFDPGLLGIVQSGTPPYITEDPWISGPTLNVPHFYPTLTTLVDRALSSATGYSTAGTTTLLTGGPQKIDSSGQRLWETMEPTAPGVWESIDEPGGPASVEKYTLNPPGTPSSLSSLDSYPRALQLSTGEVVLAGDVDTALPGVPPPSPPKTTWLIRPPFGGCAWFPCDSWELWKAEDQANDRHYGSAVLLHPLDPLDRLLVFGGSDNGTPTNTVQEYVRGPNPTINDDWESKQSMTYPRTFLNAVVLPTGEVFLVGGEQSSGSGATSVPATTPELYDPGALPTDAGSTQSLAVPGDEPSLGCAGGPPCPPGPTQRLYHSVAVLLPDGRVLVAGGDQGHGGTLYGPASEYTGEFYSPPYLFQGSGARPTFERCPKYADLNPVQAGGVTFTLKTNVPLPGSIDKIVLLRPASVTHHFDTDQRYIELSYQVTSQSVISGQSTASYTLEVDAPWTMLAPPGWYMLFALYATPAGERIPSVGQFIHFD